MLHNNFGKFVVFFSLVSFAVTICSPFFAVYVLKDLGFTYVQYMTMIVGSSLASFIFMSGWGKFADSYGNLKVMKICMGSIVAVPFLYFASYFIFKFNPSWVLPYVVFIEVLAGAMWAGFNLAAGNFIYEAVTREKMALCVSYFNVINGIGTFAGPILGGFLASIIHPILGISALLIVFMIGGIARLVVAVYMLPKIKEVREVKKYGFKEARESFQNLSLREFAEYLDINPIKTRPI
jgi:MFS family permease